MPAERITRRGGRAVVAGGTGRAWLSHWSVPYPVIHGAGR